MSSGDHSQSSPATRLPYDQEYYTETARTERVRRLGTHWWSNRYFARRVRRILRCTGGSTVLELGCAHGHILRWLADEAETHGIDMSEHAIAASRRISPRSRTVVGDVVTDLDRFYHADQFDVVLAKSVLEHIPEPLQVLVACRRLLRRGGVVVMAVPSTSNRLRRLKGEQWIGTRDPTHVSVLTPEAWEALLTRASFRPLRSYSTGLWDVPYLPFVPPLLQLPLFTLPTALALLTDGTFIPPKWGENLIIEAS
jgi:2-polyprenyl-3-methyl-5-hydroxy-6-metoxy-1,4-benzoquinol methylase